MRHRKKFNHLGRKANHRKAMLANMATSLILHKKITTTTAKAKALRMYVEPLITKSKDDSTHSRRVVFSYLQSKEAVSELFREVSPKIAERPGGYTRILKTGTRLGDAAEMCIIELVDYNENLLAAKEEAKAKSGKRRRRGGSKKKEAGEVSAEATAIETVEETKAEEKTDSAQASTTDEKVVEADAETKEVKAEETKVEATEEPATDEKVEEVKQEEEKKAEATEEVEAKKEDKEEDKSTEEKTDDASDKKDA